MENETNMIILMRHGESQKNLRLKHGGFGAELTAKGCNEVLDNTLLLKKLKLDRLPNVFYYKGVTQIDETVRILSNVLTCNIIITNEIKPISLGVLDDLSENDARNKFPTVFERLHKWRKGLIDIKAVRITDGEDVLDFWGRGKLFVENHLLCDCVNIIIAERSCLILLMNLLLGNDIRQEFGYKNYEIPTGGLITFIKQDGKYRIDCELSNFSINANQ